MEVQWSILEAMPVATIVTDSQGVIRFLNPPLARIFGYHRQDLLGQPVEILIPPGQRQGHLALRQHFQQEPAARPMGLGRELFGLTRDGREIPIEIGLNPIDTPDGRFILSSVLDLSERNRVQHELRGLNASLTAALREREVLLQEVHHRVKNNLQMISSLMNMQMRKAGPGAAREALQECQSRVQSVALIHGQLYLSDNQSKIQILSYVRSLLANISNACGDHAAVRLEARGPEMTLAVDRAIPAGLILNELATNALKHAFRGGQSGRVLIQLIEAGSQVEMAVSDDGCGLPRSFDYANCSSLGLQVVQLLVEQLDGQMEYRDLLPDAPAGRRGTIFTIRFSKEGTQDG